LSCCCGNRGSPGHLQSYITSQHVASLGSIDLFSEYMRRRRPRHLLGNSVDYAACTATPYSTYFHIINRHKNSQHLFLHYVNSEAQFIALCRTEGRYLIDLNIVIYSHQNHLQLLPSLGLLCSQKGWTLEAQFAGELSVLNFSNETTGHFCQCEQKCA